MTPKPPRPLSPLQEQRCQEAMNRIAREHLDIPTLESRHHDRLDFYDLGVASIRDALRAAYLAGRESMKKHQT